MFIREKFDKGFGEGSTANGNTRSHAHENYNKVVEAVQATECHLSIEVQWISEDKEWTDAAELVVATDIDPTGNATIRAWADLAAHQLLDTTTNCSMFACRIDHRIVPLQSTLLLGNTATVDHAPVKIPDGSKMTGDVVAERLTRGSSTVLHAVFRNLSEHDIRSRDSQGPGQRVSED
ncbi:hypothetical protein DFH08DRAFT_812193 [Mycena albidolilacea]|uniref:Uncharacterized protein n=1 Tax=Mycena albidolilacea TaxID=1033008 RepID=A0AAD6ZUL3_9AGAR|nr:hypothetical protein DFH08DRAFT_812193 [Mycena albidolilacea]